MSNFAQRTLTAFFFVAFVIGSILLGHWAFSGLFLVFTILGMLEFYKIVRTETMRPATAWGLLAAVVVYLTVNLVSFFLLDFRWLSLIPLFLLLTMVVELFRDRESPLANIAYTVFGVIYIALPFALMSWLFDPFRLGSGDHAFLLLGFFFIMWINDTGAYLTGMLIGRHKLFERISPKKTWEGVIGGLAFGMLTAWVLSLYWQELTVVQWFTLAAIIIVSGTFGDLAESMFKRSLGLKDTGTILPGHGGILDRFDGVFLAVPSVFIYLVLIK